MTTPNSTPRRPMRVAIGALAVALVAMAALIMFLIWGRSAPTVAPPPVPTLSTTPSPSIPPSPSPTATDATTPDDPTPMPTPTPTTAAPSTASTPTTVVTPSTTPPASTAAPSSAPAAAQTMMWEGKAAFDNFSVEVLSDDGGRQDGIVEDKAALLVEVCLTGAPEVPEVQQITYEAWALEDSEGNVQTPQPNGHQPAFPSDGQYLVGECTRGFLTFDFVSPEGGYAMLVHDDGLGHRAVWQFH